MRELIALFAGIVRVELVCASPEQLLERCRRMGLRLYRVRRTETCALRALLREKELTRLQALADAGQCELRVLRRWGGSRSRRFLRTRAAFLTALLLSGLLLGASSLFLWDVEVRGCETLSPGRIRRALADCGVESGTFWPGLDTDLVRSRMLTEIPELAWMTVNVSGSRAVVLVRERAKKPEIYREEAAADIVAARSGIVRSAVVWNGRCLVEPGDAVLEGETLVSGTMESITAPPRSVRALAEIRAETWHELTAVCPLEMLQRQQTRRGGSAWAIQIGKKRLLLPGTGRKGLDECDKIVHEYSMGRRDLFSFPLRLLREERLLRAPASSPLSREEEMKSALLRRLEEQVRGEILDLSYCVARSDGLLIVTLRAHCCEDIAKTAELPP